MIISGATAIYDCAVIGGGPAGLTAAIYLARYYLTVTVFDDQTSRAATIPISHNHAGFPDGISGKELLARMRAQALRYGAEFRHAQVTALRRKDGTFVVESSDAEIRAKTVLLATGVVNRRPVMPQDKHDDAVARGLLRYCPICDGFEVTDKSVGVLGYGSKGAREAVFLRSYSKEITLISPEEDHGLRDDELDRLSTLGINLEVGPLTTIDLEGEAIVLSTPTGMHRFASVYPALGSDIRSSLAAEVGADLSEEGCVTVDRHQRSTVPGIYAAGDVVIGLDQISNAMGQAGVAATAIRNDLCETVMLARR